MKRIIIITIAFWTLLSTGAMGQSATQCAQVWRNAGTDTCSRRQALEQWKRISPNDADLALALSEYYRTLAACGDVKRTNEDIPIDTTGIKVLAIDSVAQKAVVAIGSYDQRIMDNAVAALRHGIAANPDRTDLHPALIVALADAGRFDESADEIQETIHNASTDTTRATTIGQAVAYVASAMLNASETNASLAISVTRAATDVCPRDTSLLYCLESTLMLTEAYGEALKVQQRLLAVTPVNCKVMSDAAMACLATGQHEKAAEYCRNVMSRGNSEQRQLAAEILKMINCSTF